MDTCASAEEANMIKRTLTCLLAALAGVAPAGVATAAPAGPQQQLDAVHAAGMPGAFAEVRAGGHTVTLTTGVADVATGEPVSAGLSHRIGSITKTFVATTVLQLAGEGRIELDAPVGRYLPGLVPAEVGRAVTVRMLLNHTSGIGDYDTELVKTRHDVVTVGRTTYRPEQLARIGLAAARTNAPGERWSYSNTNYVLAALIVEKVTGHSYRTEVSRRILRPLGLRDTYFEGADPVIRAPHMHAYLPWTGGRLRDFDRYDMSWAWGVGEIVSTAADLDVFYAALLTGRLLPAPLLAQMQTTVVMDPKSPGADGYGLGLLWIQTPCGRFWGHDGVVFGHQTISLSSADGRTQVTFAGNITHYQTSTTEAHPIDVAIGQFLVAALCGPPAAQRSTDVARLVASLR
jgi:D-alanyl-D-alanine carboxypeptidase